MKTDTDIINDICLNNNVIIDFEKTKLLDNKSQAIIGSHRVYYKILNDDYQRSIYLKDNNMHREIIKTTNAKMFFDSNESIIIEEDVVLIDVFPHYSHLMFDMLSKFLYIKKYNKNVKAVFVDTENENETKDQTEHRKIFKEIFNELKDKIEILEYINVKDNKSYLFKNIYSIGHINKTGYQRFSEIEDFVLEIRNMFIPKRKSTCDKNIFISRKDIFTKRIENKNMLENFLKQKNYSVCFLEDMSFSEQIELFYDAKNIVAINGCSLTNMLFANNDSNIISIHSDPNYYATEWRTIAKKININYIEIYSQTNNIHPVLNILQTLEGKNNE